jgi:hypothetical protein
LGTLQLCNPLSRLVLRVVGHAIAFSGIALSTLITGVVTRRFGYTAGLLGVTAVGGSQIVGNFGRAFWL